MLEGFCSGDNNKAIAERDRNTVAFMGRRRATGLNAVSFSERRITSNLLHESSKLARRFGIHLELAWEHSEPDLIYPGMPARVLYIESGALKEVYGVVLRTYTQVSAVGTGPSINRHRSTTVITLFVERT